MTRHLKINTRKPKTDPETRNQVDPRTLAATSVFAGEVGYLAVAQWLSSLAPGHGACSCPWDTNPCRMTGVAYNPV